MGSAERHPEIIRRQRVADTEGPVVCVIVRFVRGGNHPVLDARLRRVFGKPLSDEEN